MGELFPELAPEAAPALLDALPPLFVLAGCLFALGLIKLLDAFVRALFGFLIHTLNGIPFVSVGSTLLHAVESAITEALGAAEVKLDSTVGASFHKLARIADKLGRELWNKSQLIFGLAALIVTLLDFANAQKLWNSLVGKQQATLAPRIARVERHAHAETKAVAATATHAAHVAHATAATGTLVWEPDIAKLRHRTRAIEDSLGRAWHWIRAHPLVLAESAAVAVVTAALGRLGLRWLRCSKWSKLGPRVCGLPTSLFEDLLGLVADFFFLTNVCEVIPWLEAAFSTVAAPLVEALTYAGAGLCDPGASAPELLPAPTLHLPARPSLNLYTP